MIVMNNAIQLKYFNSESDVVKNKNKNVISTENYG